MKTNNNIEFKLGLILLGIFLITGVNYLSSQDNPFVTLKDGSFKYNCENFRPLVMNYAIHRIKVYNNNPNDEYHISPIVGYCHSFDCGPEDKQRTCGENALDWKNEMKEQFIKIAELNFNMVRVIGLMEIRYNPDLNGVDSYPYLHTTEYLEQRSDLNCYDKKKGLHIDDQGDREELGNLLQEVIDALYESGTDLKLIVLMGGHGVEMMTLGYEYYLSYIATRFKDEPRIFAYDLYNEPVWFKYPQTPQPTKYEIAEMCMNWYNAIRDNAPSQFVTMGLEISDVCQWDPEIVPLDFISFHHYQKLLGYYEQYSIIPPLKRFKARFKWLSNTISKPYIIGETGLPGIDPNFLVSPPNPWPPYWPSIQEQADYANFTLQYSKLYNSKGYSWYDYKDKYTWAFEDDSDGDDFLGVVFNDNVFPDTETAKPQTAEVFLQIPGLNDCYDIIEQNGPCTEPGEEYYHPNPVNYSNDTLLTGIIKDENGNGIEDAYIEASIKDVTIDDWRVSHAITHNSGEFEIMYSMPSIVAYVDKITVSYPGREAITYPKDEIPPSGIIVLPILNPSQLPPMPSYEYYTVPENSVETWETQRYLPYKEITIKEGAVLTVTEDVFLDENAKIIVERKGKLVVDGGRITSSCGMWKGIEVWGYAFSPLQSEQGIVEIKNGSVIENAERGIYAHKEDLTYDYYGGIIKADDSYFINNAKSASLHVYSSYESYSYFKNCDFEVNDEYMNTVPFECFIKLDNMKNVDIKGCSFTNLRSIISGKGVKVNQSQFSIDGICLDNPPPQGDCVNWDSTEFNNLEYGIYVTMINSTWHVDVKQTVFNNNYKGAYLSAASRPTFVFCDFNIGSSGQMYGLYLERCTGYTIEENYFHYNSHSNKGNIGLYINNSGANPNMVYHNNFNNLQYAVVALNQNRGLEGGLQFKCNNYTQCGYDMTVVKDKPGTYMGIAFNQGSSVNLVTAPAGNRFSYTGPMGTPTDINNQGTNMQYWYHDNDFSFRLRPQFYTNNVMPQLNQQPWSESTCCPPNFGTGGGTGSSESMMEEMLSARQSADSIEYVINLLKDGGNTQDLREEVEISFPPQSLQVYNELMNTSPYLSDTVLGTAIEKEYVLVDAMIRDIMVANPQSAKDDDLLQQLDERNNPLPEYMIGQILQGRSLVTTYEALQSQLSYFNQKHSNAFNNLVDFYLSDTMNTQSSNESLKALLNNENEINAKYELAFLIMWDGDWNGGFSILNGIPEQFNLTDEQQYEHQSLVEYCTLLASINETIPDSLQTAQLMLLAEQEQGIASVYSRNHLIALEKIEYEEPIVLPEYMKSSQEIKYEQLIQKANEVKYIEVFPNPSKDYVIISWKLETGMANPSIIITNTDAVEIDKFQINVKENQKVIKASGLKPGIYCASLFDSVKLIDSIKFSIVK